MVVFDLSSVNLPEPEKVNEINVDKWILEIRSYPSGLVVPKLIPIGKAKVQFKQRIKPVKELEIKSCTDECEEL